MVTGLLRKIDSPIRLKMNWLIPFLEKSIHEIEEFMAWYSLLRYPDSKGWPLLGSLSSWRNLRAANRWVCLMWAKLMDLSKYAANLVEVKAHLWLGFGCLFFGILGRVIKFVVGDDLLEINSRIILNHRVEFIQFWSFWLLDINLINI